MIPLFKVLFITTMMKTIYLISILFVIGVMIEVVNTYKYLGVIIEDKLDWDAHAS